MLLYNLVMEHEENISIVLSCIDYRFWPDALPKLEKKFGTFDLIELAGGSKNLASPASEADRRAILESIQASVGLHGAKQLILTNHTDCGAYGGSEAFNSQEDEIEFHQSELKKAASIIRKTFPDLEVQRVIIALDDKNKIQLMKVP